MTKFTLEITLNDDAMRDAFDVGQALQELGSKLTDSWSMEELDIFDYKGALVGTALFTEI